MRHVQIRHAHIACTTALRTFILMRKGLLLNVDKYEPHTFRQFGNEQSIDNTIRQDKSRQDRTRQKPIPEICGTK